MSKRNRRKNGVEVWIGAVLGVGLVGAGIYYFWFRDTVSKKVAAAKLLSVQEGPPAPPKSCVPGYRMITSATGKQICMPIIG